MSKQKNKLKIIILTFLVFFQSCRVYKQAPVTIDEAIASQKRVKITTVNQTKLKFEKVINEEGKYYGIKSINGTLEKIPITLSTIDTIRVHNRTMSIAYGSAITAVVSFYTVIALVLLPW